MDCQKTGCWVVEILITSISRGKSGIILGENKKYPRVYLDKITKKLRKDKMESEEEKMVK